MDSRPAPHDLHRLGRGLVAILFLAGAAAVFLSPPDCLVGSARADIGQQFLAWRAFAADSLRAGRWPLWNPYSYAGEPFLGGLQSAVFYPLNAIFLVLPLCRALNLSILIHLFILGGGMHRWATQRGLHPLAAGLCGLILPLSGPVFPHLYAGHLSNLCTLAWAPWIFASLEAWYAGGSWRRLLVASAAVCLQILAGQAQYVFYTGVAAAIHAAAVALAGPGGRRRALALPAVAGVYAGAALLAAAQLIPAAAAAAEGVRQAGTGPEFAGQFSLPPENLLTAVAPGFFGDPVRHVFWGRCYPWEMSVFLGVSGCVLLGVALSDPVRGRSARIGVGVALSLLLLSLGRHTPLFQCLYAGVPGFDRFRGWSKFTFPAAAFLALAAGEGAEALLRRRPPGRAPVLAALAAGFAGAVAGCWLWAHPARIAPFMAWVRDRGESYLPAVAFADPATIRAAGVQAGLSLAIAGVLAVAIGVSLALARRHAAMRWVVLGLVPVELAGFAWTQFDHFRRSDAVLPELRDFVAAHPGDYRVQNLLEPNNGYLIGAPDVWGNDPGVLRRYAEFMAFTQGENPDQATQNVTFRALTPLYGVLRLRYLFSRTDAGLNIYEVPGAMDRVQLVSACRVLPRRDQLFQAMSRPGFDPRETVLLEEEPRPRPSPAAGAGTVRILSASPDQLTVEADVGAASLLLVTDSYSRDWHARPLAGSSQAHYDVMPADYILRATPLAAGHHVIRFDYAPGGMGAGLAISAAAWAAWVALMMAGRPVRRTGEGLVP